MYTCPTLTLLAIHNSRCSSGKFVSFRALGPKHSGEAASKPSAEVTVEEEVDGAVGDLEHSADVGEHVDVQRTRVHVKTVFFDV